MIHAITFGTQSTMDYTCRIDDQKELIDILKNADEFLDGKAKEDIKNLKDLVEKGGLTQDKEMNLDGESLDRLVKSIDKEKLHKSGGGSPFISAWAGVSIGYSVGDVSLPDVYFVGLLPANVGEYLQETKCYFPDMKQYALAIEEKPATLSFELGNRKVMISSKKGRELKDMDKEAYIRNLVDIKNMHPNGKVVVALGGLNKGTPGEYSYLIDLIKNSLGESSHIFVGTNSFEGKTNDHIRDCFGVIKKADIVSFNEVELDAVYSAVCGPEDSSLAEKLRKLPHHGIKICHSAEGAILDLNYIPQKILSQRAMENPIEFLTESLTLAADGTSYLIEHLPRSNRYPNLTAVKNFSSSVYQRQNQGLHNKFNKQDDEKKQNGMIYAAAPQIKSPLSRITGAGAVFDGFVLSLLMRDYSK